MSAVPIITRQSNFGPGIGLAIILGLLVLGFIFYENGAIDPSILMGGTKYKTIKIENLSLRVRVAKTPAEQLASLNNIKVIPKNEGMLFVFAEDGTYSMSVKDMLFPVDLMWIDQDGTIVDAQANVSPGQRDPVQPRTRARYVLMVNSGLMDAYGIVIRTSVNLAGIR